MKKLFFLILLIAPSTLCWGQFATQIDSSGVARWEFTTFTDVDDSLTAGYQIYQKIDTTTSVRAAIHDSLDANWAAFTADDTVDTYREAIADTIADHWTVFTAAGDPGAAIHDSLDANWAVFIADENDTVTAYRAAIHDSLDANWSVFISDDTVDTYREAIHDSLDANWATFTAGGGGGANADSIKDIPIEDTTDNIGDLHGLLFDQSADSLKWEEFWATPVTDPTDNYLLKIDTDPDPDTFYWAPDIIRKTAEIQTIDATPTTLVSHTLLDENTYHTEAQVVAVQSDGTDRASYHIACTVYRTGAGVATLQGSVTTLHTQESNVALDATFTVSGSAVRVSVTGIVAETWEFGGTMTYINISN